MRTRRLVPCALALLLACAMPSVARAGFVPTPGNVTLPAGITLVGDYAGAIDPAGIFVIVIRDFAQNPIPGALVGVHFSGCGADLRICAVPGLPEEEETVVCHPPTVTAVTDATGTATFSIRGGGQGLDPVSTGLCAQVVADGVIVGSLRVAAFDLNGAGGVGPPDISYWISDYFRSATSLIYFSRGDYDFNGALTPADLALLLQSSLRGKSVSSCTNPCN